MRSRGRAPVTFVALTLLICSAGPAPASPVKLGEERAYCLGRHEIAIQFWKALAQNPTLSANFTEPAKHLQAENEAVVKALRGYFAARGLLTEGQFATELGHAHDQGRIDTQACFASQVGPTSCSVRCLDSGGSSEQCADRCSPPEVCTRGLNCGNINQQSIR